MNVNRSFWGIWLEVLLGAAGSCVACGSPSRAGTAGAAGNGSVANTGGDSVVGTGSAGGSGSSAGGVTSAPTGGCGGIDAGTSDDASVGRSSGSSGMSGVAGAGGVAGSSGTGSAEVGGTSGATGPGEALAATLPASPLSPSMCTGKDSSSESTRRRIPKRVLRSTMASAPALPSVAAATRLPMRRLSPIGAQDVGFFSGRLPTDDPPGTGKQYDIMKIEPERRYGYQWGGASLSSSIARLRAG